MREGHYERAFFRPFRRPFLSHLTRFSHRQKVEQQPPLLRSLIRKADA